MESLEGTFAVGLFFGKNNHYIVVLSIIIYVYCKVVCPKFFQFKLLMGYLLIRGGESFNFLFFYVYF